MQYRTLGNSGLIVSEVGIGCNAFGARTDLAEVQKIVAAAEENGVNFFDTADVYSLGESEKILGKALARRRENVVIATKFGMDMQGANGPDYGVRNSRKYIRRAVEGSLRRLNTDYIDLYQIHQLDEITPLEETLDTLNQLVTEGKVRYIGSSNFTAWQVVKADLLSEIHNWQPCISAQNEYSLYNRVAEIELLPASHDRKVSILPYFPLAYGLLTGKYLQGQAAPAGSRLAGQTNRLEEANFDLINQLQHFADQHGVSLLTVAIGGLLDHDEIGSVISGVSKAEQVTINAAASYWRPTEADRIELAAIGAPKLSQNYRIATS